MCKLDSISPEKGHTHPPWTWVCLNLHERLNGYFWRASKNQTEPEELLRCRGIHDIPEHPRWPCSPVQSPRSDAVCTLTGLHLGCKCAFVHLSSIHNLHVLEISTARTEHSVHDHRPLYERKLRVNKPRLRKKGRRADKEVPSIRRAGGYSSSTARRLCVPRSTRCLEPTRRYKGVGTTSCAMCWDDFRASSKRRPRR